MRCRDRVASTYGSLFVLLTHRQSSIVAVCASLALACGGKSRARDQGSPAGSRGGAGGGGAGGTTANGGAAAAGNAGAGAGGTGAGGGSGCPASMIDACNPGPGRWCTEERCEGGSPWPGDEVLERGKGVLCKFFPDASGPDFACLEGEWCHGDPMTCRCGAHAGCQLGEQCTAACEDDPLDYACSRQVACTDDNLSECGAAPGELCRSGSLTCTAAESCNLPGSGEDTLACGSGCCPAGHWCFDDIECRCGAHPACDELEDCALGSIGFYECRGR
jgi:hypothetical protein